MGLRRKCAVSDLTWERLKMPMGSSRDGYGTGWPANTLRMGKHSCREQPRVLLDFWVGLSMRTEIETRKVISNSVMSMTDPVR